MKTTYRYPRKPEPKQTRAQAAAFAAKMRTLTFNGAGSGIHRQEHPAGGIVESVVHPKQVRRRVDPRTPSEEGLK